MRKHIDYFYKCYDRIYDDELQRRQIEAFNEYGYNFDSNNRREFQENFGKTNYQECQKRIRNKENK